MPNVSVCIPTYNRKEFLRQTLQSVFAQTYKDFEVVIVDDGSTDGTAEMVRSLKHPIRYQWQENRGDANARNHLVRLAEGRCITFIDSDDLLMPDAVERMVSAAESQGTPVVVYGPYLTIDEAGQVKHRKHRRQHSGWVTAELFQSIFVHAGGSLFPTALLREVGEFDESLKVCSDYDMWLRLSLKCPFIALERPTFKRRRHKGNLSARSLSNQLTKLKVLERFYRERGGKEKIPRRIAMRRLSKEAYRAGRCALAEGNTIAARRYFAQASRQHLNPKAMMMWLLASLKRGK